MNVAEKEILRADNVHEAAQEMFKIIQLRGRIFCLDCWDGFGASAVLRYMAAMLPSRRNIPELCFDRIIFIDCSKWNNRRAVQRAIAQELTLDRSIMATLDKQDEEDDFKGIGESSRNEIGSVAQVIEQTLTGTKFMMFFLNGSDDEVDIGSFGIPLTRFGKNMMIWTFNRCCLTMHRHVDRLSISSNLRYTHVFIYSFRGARSLIAYEFQELLHQQCATIVARSPSMLDINPTMVKECCLYGLFLHYIFHISTKLDWIAHASNYWICDAIIQGDKARDVSNTLHGEINWEGDATVIDEVLQMLMKYFEHLFLVVKDDDVYKEGSYRWISVTSKNMEICGMQTIPAVTSSLFLAFERSDHPPTLQKGFFEHSNKLGVLVLCFCAFNFASPPFHHCQNLRFLGLDHCTRSKTCEADNHQEWACLYNLLVLDLRYTEWDNILSEEKMDLMKSITELNIEGVRCWRYTAQLQGRLPNLERLRIIKPTCQHETSNDVDNSFTDKKSMKILDFSGNSDMKTLPTSLSKASRLQMLILDGCDGLESIVASGLLPPSLKTFSFDGYGPTRQRTSTVELPPKDFRPPPNEEKKGISTSRISLVGCTQLDNLFLRGLPNLVELDLSGTAIKKLDFKTMVVQVPRLKRLFLIGCKHLRAIISLEKIDHLELVCIDTRAGIVCPYPIIDKHKSFQLHVHAVLADARITHSLRELGWGPKEDVTFNIHITSSPVQFEATSKDKVGPSDQENPQQLIRLASRYSDVLRMVGDPLVQVFLPPAATPKLDRHIEISQGRCHMERHLKESLDSFMGLYAESLHFHDVSTRAITPQGHNPNLWKYLRWCCVERCPKLNTCFPLRSHEYMAGLAGWWMTNWLSKIDPKGFSNLQHLHLCFCPSLQFVLPMRFWSLPSLETLYIIHCGGDLNHVFMQDEMVQTGIGRNRPRILPCPKLTTIHLHDLPKLQKICEVSLLAPALQTIKIKGCWSLRRLPSVRGRSPGEKKPTIEIEKDVWDALEWDADHLPDQFETPVHSRYYKEKLPRVSVLR
ncbi:uncharacterized protein [Triticum aestivum]|uniref:Disease resistance protein At4g27190-like leucine-rich repeats domain-containing protein n=1 Tax=Triticum aestivum TaxID=4565 RepID=A0A3B6U7E7_WHEAT|nr:uncharacterized protein LOC123175696 [Triticum aestivum]